MKKIIFIGGSPRSGTTLVQNILDSHPEIHGMPEFHHLPEIIRLHGRMRESLDKRFITDICTRDEIDHRIRGMIEEFLEPVRKRAGTEWLSEKTPQNCLVFDGLIELFPECRIIHVVRDPRAVLSSMLAAGNKMRRNGQKPHLIVASADNAIFEIKKNISSGYEGSMRFPDQIHTIVYEDLLADMEGETRRLCDFLEVDWTENMTRPHEFDHPGEQAMTTEANAMYYDKTMFRQKPDTAVAHKWKSTLKPADQVLATITFRRMKEYRALGYMLDLDHLSFLEKARGSLICGVRLFLKRLRGTLHRLCCVPPTALVIYLESPFNMFSELMGA